MLRTASRRWLAAGLLILAASAPAVAGNWPRWRGPNNDGVSPETNIPTEWGETKNIAWALTLPGRSGATPAVWGNRIFLTSDDGKQVLLHCVSTDGRELWQRKLSAGGKRYNTGRGGRGRGGNQAQDSYAGEGDDASPSPSTDGKHVYTFTGAGVLSCHDLDGNEVWQFNVQDRYGQFRIQWGMHVTPLLDGDRLYLSLIHSGALPALVVALDKASGKEIWKATRPSDGRAECEQSYASPMIYRHGGTAYLVIHGNDYTTAHSLDDGHELWRLGDLNPKDRYNPTLRFVATPLVTPELIVVPTAKGGPVVGVKPTARGKVGAGSEGEQWRLRRGTPDVPSPLLHDGLVYLCSEQGILTSLEAKTGKELYSERLHSALYRASPVYADGKVYLTARDGVITVVKAGPKFEKLAENRLPDTITASPVIADGILYLRGFKALYAIGPASKG